MNVKPNRNKTNFEKFQSYFENSKNNVDYDILQTRIKENLDLWELKITKQHNCPYIPSVAKMVKTVQPTRLLLKNRTPEINERMTYIIAKHLINTGCSPSKTIIVNLEDCYLSIRGFGDKGIIKNKIFNNDNEIIIIENMRNIRQTDITDNVYSFWKEFLAYCKKNKNLHILLCFEEQKSEKYMSTEDKKYLIELGFKIN